MRHSRTDSVKEKLALLIFGALAILVIIPAMDAYTASVGGRNPIDYKLWEGLYLVFFIAVRLL